jgi:hypothetical protein
MEKIKNIVGDYQREKKMPSPKKGQTASKFTADTVNCSAAIVDNGIVTVRIEICFLHQCKPTDLRLTFNVPK